MIVAQSSARRRNNGIMWVMSVPMTWARRGSAAMSGELVVAWVRVAATASMVALVAFGDDSVRQYPGWAWAANLGALAYSWVAFGIVRSFSRRGLGEPPGLAWGLTVADSAAILAVVATTGAGESLYIPLATLEVIAVAIRFNLRQALLLAGCIGAALAVVILTVPEPDFSNGHRVQTAIWWAWLLIAAAGLVGFLSRLAEDAWAGRVRAEEDAEAEHRRLTQERQLRQQLEALENTRRDFLHAVAHDFRTPIASLEALSRALARQGDLDPEQRMEITQIIESHARHVGSLLVAVREVALAESLGPDRGLQLTDVYFAEMARDSASAAGLAPERVAVNVEPAVAVLRTDPDKMQRILTNLLENAGRHSPTTEPIDVRLAARGGLVVLEVADRGPGMPAEVASRAFEKFFGFGEARGSSGLGMWIVAQLTEALGGTVAAEPRPGGGLVVTMTQPLIQPSRPRSDPATHPGAVGARRAQA